MSFVLGELAVSGVCTSMDPSMIINDSRARQCPRSDADLTWTRRLRPFFLGLPSLLARTPSTGDTELWFPHSQIRP